ncbi:diaminopimelate decarboxylase [Achromobacter sp. HZ01]|uniref:Diaminopimelate decarboxylase n=1 Tax=Achromobacter pulmonis TaxID=1389932 RepID=A0A2N8KKY3_9BURK|nr:MULTISPECIES: diaminopimelate decarboxylase [Achromobacter]PND34112.1 diaminopimelate decarboxylase [Achromobacter pulmonis]RAP64788.1 diaminopimelate decarboxylase [Achromobacter sp. HZ01]
MAFDPRQLTRLAAEHGTPLWVYDAAVIRERIAQLRRFDTIRYAQKACSNLHILRLMRAEGAVVDAVSLGEIERSLAAGFQPRGEPEGIVFTADLIDHATLAAVLKHGITVNAGSLDMLDRVGQAAPGHRVWLRINPGFGHGHSNKTNTGGPQSKHGIWIGDLAQAMAIVRRHGLKLVGIHMHIGSGVDYAHLSSVCNAMVDVVASLDHDIEAISAGGGLSIPYRDGEPRIDCDHYFQQWDAARRRIAERLGHPVRLEIEPGRFLVAEAGALVAEVHSINRRPERDFALVDAGFNDLMRPAMYGSYHRISVHAPDGQTPESPAVRIAVAGPLCESGDVFTQDAGGVVSDQLLPRPRIGDFLVFHSAGAYGSSMSSNYNSRPLAPEVLLDGGQARLIRRRQTVAELLALEETPT